MKTALVHDWLVGLGGAERVICSILEEYPSPIYTLLKSKKFLETHSLNRYKIQTSFIQLLPFPLSLYRNYLPLFPFAIERFNLRKYDLIISSSHAVAKGIKVFPHQLHICYCHTPIRYAWDLQDEYLSQINPIKASFAKPILCYLRNWDKQTSDRVNYFIANSQYVAERIERHYHRKATVIYPPVTTTFSEYQLPKQDFYITVSRLVPYKKIDLIVEAFNQMPEKKIYIIGEGPLKEELERIAKPNVKFLGFCKDSEVKKYLTQAKAFIFAAEEDFGIVAVEAQAAGTPVIAYGKGGVLETVIPYKTGIFFDEQTVEKLKEAVKLSETMEFNPENLKFNAERFSENRFRQEIKKFIEEKWKVFCEDRYSCRG